MLDNLRFADSEPEVREHFFASGVSVEVDGHVLTLRRVDHGSPMASTRVHGAIPTN